MKRFHQWVALCAVFMMALICFSGCDSKPKDGKGNGGNIAEGLPKIELSDKTVKVMANWTGNEADVIKLKEQSLANYGIDLQVQSVGWADIPQKLASLVITGQAPDMVLKRSDQDDFPSFIINELVQPIDDFIDLKHPLYADLQDAYKMTEWNGKHYVALVGIGTGTAVYYNKKMLEDNGQELPWDLYQRGEWDWDKLKEIALAVKVEKDGTVEQYGFALHRPYPWAYTVGKAFGSLDGANKTIVNNLQDPDFARAMNYLSDMIINDKVCPSRIDGALDLFRREQTPILIAEQVYQTPEVMELAAAGNLGIAPMPKDPKADAHYVRGTTSGWFIPTGAKNPQGAIAVISTSIYQSTNATAKAENNKLMKEKYALSDENLTQLETAHKTGVKPVLENTPWIGYDTVWLMVGNNVNWTTQVDTDLPRINARISEMFEKKEYDPPTGPKIIDDFEKHGSDTKSNIKRYTPMSGGDTALSIKLVKDDKKEGTYAACMQYALKDKLWGGLGRSINKSWNGNNTLRLWLKGDGQKQTVGLQFITTGGATWTYKLNVQSKEWKQYDIPLKDFELPDWVTDVTTQDLTSIATFNLSVGSEKAQTGTLLIDKIEVLAK